MPLPSPSAHTLQRIDVRGSSCRPARYGNTAKAIATQDLQLLSALLDVLQHATHCTRSGTRPNALSVLTVHRSCSASLGISHNDETTPDSSSTQCDRVEMRLERRRAMIGPGCCAALTTTNSLRCYPQSQRTHSIATTAIVSCRPPPSLLLAMTLHEEFVVQSYQDAETPNKSRRRNTESK